MPPFGLPDKPGAGFLGALREQMLQPQARTVTVVDRTSDTRSISYRKKGPGRVSVHAATKRGRRQRARSRGVSRTYIVAVNPDE